jgi:hypothetical protein
VSTIELALHNNGTVTTQSGICQLSGGADPSAGVFRADGKDLRIGGAFDLIQSATLTGINGGVIILEYVQTRFKSHTYLTFIVNVVMRRCPHQPDKLPSSLVIFHSELLNCAEETS